MTEKRKSKFKPVEAWAVVSEMGTCIEAHGDKEIAERESAKAEAAWANYGSIGHIKAVVSPCLIVPADAVVFESAEELGDFLDKQFFGERVTAQEAVKLVAEWRKSREGEK